ncbi:para-aminobenzoate synthase, aminase component [Vibrio sp. JCM 19053]|nr:para-aminobenzoate synthase, aminase component [Vibrio sp. JCM 19053]
MDNQFIDFKALEYAPEFALHLFFSHSTPTLGDVAAFCIKNAYR